MLDAFDQLKLEVQSQTTTTNHSERQSTTGSLKSCPTKEEETTPPPIRHRTKPVLCKQGTEPSSTHWTVFVVWMLKLLQSDSEKGIPKPAALTRPKTTLLPHSTTYRHAVFSGQVLSSATSKASSRLIQKELNEHTLQRMLASEIRSLITIKSKSDIGGREPMFEPCPDQEIVSQMRRYDKSREPAMSKRKVVAEARVPMFEPCPDSNMASNFGGGGMGGARAVADFVR